MIDQAGEAALEEYPFTVMDEEENLTSRRLSSFPYNCIDIKVKKNPPREICSSVCILWTKSLNAGVYMIFVTHYPIFRF